MFYILSTHRLQIINLSIPSHPLIVFNNTIACIDTTHFMMCYDEIMPTENK